MKDSGHDGYFNFVYVLLSDRTRCGILLVSRHDDDVHFDFINHLYRDCAPKIS